MPDSIREEIQQIQTWLSNKLIEVWKRDYKNDLGKLHFEQDPHISLTKVGVMLQLHWINEFTSTLRNRLQRAKVSYVTFGEIVMFMNEDKTRIFIGKFAKL